MMPPSLWDEALPLLCTHFGVELVSLRVLDEHARFAQFTDVPTRATL